MATRPTPRPKRGGEEFARGHYHDTDSSSPKKPRFDIRNPSALAPDAPEEDVVLDADEIGKRGQRTKRNAVNIDGFESDSSNEGFDGRAEAKAKEAKGAAKESKAADEDDMFADLEEEEDDFADGGEDAADEATTTSKKQKKKVKFLEVEAIEGQSMRSKSGGHVHINVPPSLEKGKKAAAAAVAEEEESSSSDSEVGDEARAELDSDLDAELGAGAKKKHAPKIDAFNLNAEKEDGGFDEQLNYVRKAADPDAVHDSWLDGVSKRDMKRAREAQDRRDRDLRDKNREDDAVITGDMLAALVARLQMGETVLAALARLGPGKKKKNKKTTPKWQGRKKGGEEMQVEPSSAASSGTTTTAFAAEEDRVEKARGEAVEAITGAADRLMGRGYNDIYDTQREALIRHYEKETGEGWAEKGDEEEDDDDDDKEEDRARERTRSAPSGSGGVGMWEYRWSDARDGGNANGPYDAATMRAWNSAGYFGEGVEFREMGPAAAGGEWSPDATF